MLTQLSKDYIDMVMESLKIPILEKIEDTYLFKFNLRGYFTDPELLNIMKNAIYNVDDIDDLSKILNGIATCWEVITRRLASPIITPWRLESTRDHKNLGYFLGTGNKQLPITVVVNNNKRYVHRLTEELMFGIISVTYSFDIFTYYLEDIPILLEDFLDNYTTNSNKRFNSVLGIRNIYFDTIDVVQGIITAASWLNVDPHTYIKDITDNGVLITF